MNKFLFLTVLSLLLSCKNDENNNSNETTPSIIVTSLSSEKQVEEPNILFSSNDIKSFNIATGEIIFNNEVIKENIRPSSQRSLCFYLNGEHLFNTITFTETSSIMSHIINDLVLFHNTLDGKIYLQDGYPSIDILGDSKEKDQALREKNKEKRIVSWKLFINALKIENKLIE